MFTHILTNFKKEDNKELEINYVRLLGFNKRGRSYLNKIKKDMEIPVVTGYNKINDKIFNIEDVIELSELINVPIVFDYHHHICNHNNLKIDFLKFFAQNTQ